MDRKKVAELDVAGIARRHAELAAEFQGVRHEQDGAFTTIRLATERMKDLDVEFFNTDAGNTCRKEEQAFWEKAYVEAWPIYRTATEKLMALQVKARALEAEGRAVVEGLKEQVQVHEDSAGMGSAVNEGTEPS